MMDMKELLWQHAKVMILLIVFTAIAITLLSGGKLFKDGSPQLNAITSHAVSTPSSWTSGKAVLVSDKMKETLRNIAYLLVLIGVLLAGSQARFLFGGRMPKTEEEEKLLQYILLARENGFEDADIIERLVLSGWEYGMVEKAMNAPKQPQSLQTSQRKL